MIYKAKEEIKEGYVLLLYFDLKVLHVTFRKYFLTLVVFN